MRVFHAPGPDWAVVGTPAEVRVAARAGQSLWLRGVEAAGPISDTSALVLIRAAVNAGRAWVVEGLGIGGQAAALAVGAAGIVVGPESWLASDADPHAHAQRLSKTSSGRDTTVRGDLEEQRRRVLAGPGAIDAPQNVALAARFAGRPTAEIVDQLTSEVRRHLAAVHAAPALDDPLGCGVPVVQGPMANVSEATGLALAVRAAGAMPFAALGALDPDRAASVLANWAREVPRPWGAGLIGFEVMPHRDAHIEALLALGDARPDAVIVAGGSPTLAADLQARGLSVWLHTPSAGLVSQALEAGVRAVVLEGREAGGHVGALTSAGLWEEGLGAVEQAVMEGIDPPLVVLAGGLGDRPSAAFAHALAAPARARGVRVVLQAGTAFLLTHEIVESGQVTTAYQGAVLACHRTVLVGTSVNLALRVPPGVYATEARALERRLDDDGLPRAERRMTLEHHNLGRARIAAKGIERNPAHADNPAAPRHRPVPANRQLREGAFTCGQGATLTTELSTVRAVVDALAGRRPSESPWGAPVHVAGAPTATAGATKRIQTETLSADIAVVGMGCIVPGALDVPTFWRNLVHGVDAVGPVPAGRWGHANYYDPAASTTGPVATYSRHAGAISGFEFDPLEFRIPPKAVATMDPSQRLALAASAEAVARAGWDKPGAVDPERAAVVLGNAMGGEFAKGLSLRVRFREVIEALRSDEVAAGWSVADVQALEDRIEARLARDLPPVEVDSMAGLLSNVVAGRVASWLDWMGGNLTVDAACAASLAALAVAVDWLRTGRCDAALAGGVDTDLSAETYVGFSRTRALSSGGSRPFADGADGFVMGEGAAVFALKRLDDALRDGDPVWAVIRGVGQSSDGRGRGITAPRAEGQALAVERAWRDAGVDPDEIGFIEAHGTGTALGDRTEVGVLTRQLAQVPAPVWLGSVKSMVGHLKGAAGAAGLGKAVLSVLTGVVPPTLHAGPPNPALGLSRSPLRLPRMPVQLDAQRRVGGVSAFGFGGTNFHVVLGPAPDHARVPVEAEAFRAQAAPHVTAPAAAVWAEGDSSPLLIPFGAPDEDTLRAQVAADQPCGVEHLGELAVRLVVVTDVARRAEAVGRAARWLDDRSSPPPPGVFHGAGAAPRLVLMFPGQGSQRGGALDALRRLPAGARDLERVGALLATHLDGAASLTQREGAPNHVSANPVDLHATLFALGVGWAAVLSEAGVPIAGCLGHSLGAYAALVAAGAWSADDAAGPVIARGRALQACPPGAMVAVRLGQIEAQRLAERHGLVVAATNAPGQAVLAGPRSAIAAATREVGAAVATPLDVERAYHSPAVAPAARAVAAVIAAAPPTEMSIPVWSARTTKPVVHAADDLVQGIVQQVRFAETVAAIQRAGPVLFIEAGPGGTLSRLVRANGGHAVALDPGRDRGVVWAAAELLASGHLGLAQSLPGTLVARPLPFLAVQPRHGAMAQPEEPGELRTRAEAVQDLRIAALADPSHRPAWRAARAALLADLARRDATPSVAVAVAAAPEPTAPSARHVTVVPEVPPPPEPSPPSDIQSAVRSAICDITGYPPEYVEDGADLEGDLGIDSIRKMEILGLLEQRLGFTTAEADYARLVDADLSTLVAHVEQRLGLATADAVDQPLHEARIHVAQWRAVDEGIPTSPFLHIRGDADPAETVASLQRLSRTAPPDHVQAVVPQFGPAGAAAAAFLRSWAREVGTHLELVHEGRGAVWRTDWVPLAPTTAADLPDRAVWVVTGGLGIAAQCLIAIAHTSPRVLLLGRRKPAAVADALDPLVRAGIEVLYRSCDVTDPIRTRRAVDEARQRWGRIDCVLHAAAQLRDGPAAASTSEDLERVWGTKVGGGKVLGEATADDDLSLWCVFSSLVVHVGNPGQTLYGAANAALETQRHPRATRHLAVAWTAWSEIGMAAEPALQRLLAARGVHPLSPEVGSRAFRDLVLGDVSGVVRVAAQPVPHDTSVAWPLGRAAQWRADHRAFALPLDPAQPALADHRVAGRPLVPAAVWVSALLEAVVVSAADAGPWEVQSLEISAPTFVDQTRTDLQVALAREPDGGWRGRILAGETVVCTARLHRCAPPATESPPHPLQASESAAPLYRPDLLFHGPTWRVLQRVETDQADRAAADLRVPDGVSGVAGAIDGAHQLLCAWAGRSRGWLGLPVGADRWVYSGGAEGPLRLEARAAPGADRELTADVMVVDGRGRVVLRGEGVRMRAATRDDG